MRASGLPRSSLFVTTKVPCCPGTKWVRFCNSTGCASDVDTRQQVEHDLATLQLDYVDLLLLHWPCDTLEDNVRTYKVMESYVKAGKARAIGLSNFNAARIEELLPHVSIKPAINQCAFSIAGHASDEWGRDDATVAACKRHNITYEAYSPLGGWALGGTSRVLNDPTVKAIAQAHNKSSAQVALRWVVQQGIVAVTASNELAYDLADLALWGFALSAKEMAVLAALK